MTTPEEELTIEANRRLEAGECFDCGQPGAFPASFMRVMSFLVFTRHSEWDEFVCPSCAAKTGSRELAISSALGWWGFPWGLLTFKAVWINVRTLLKTNLYGRGVAAAIVGLLVGGGVALGQAIAKQSRERREAKQSGNWVSQDAVRKYERARELLASNRVDAAIPLLKQALESAPDSSAINHALGDAHIRLGDAKQARGYLEKALAKMPDSSGIRHSLAYALQMLGDFDTALVHLAKTVEDPKVPLYVHEQYIALAQALDKDKPARSFYAQFRERNAGLAHAHYLHGILLESPAERVKAMDAALGIDGNFQKAHVKKTVALIALRDWKRAREACQHVRAPQPQDQARGVLAATIERDQGRPAKALEIVDRRIAQGQENYAVLLQRATILTNLERFDDAKLTLDKAAALEVSDPIRFVIACQSSYARLQAGDPSSAREHLDSAKKLAGKPSRGQTASLAMLEARIAWYENELNTAIDALERCPPGIDGLFFAEQAEFDRGLLLLLSKQGAEARKILEPLAKRELGIEPEPILSARLLLGQTTPKAYFAEAAKDAFYENDAHYYIAVVHEQAGRIDDARKAYEQCVATSIGANHPRRLAESALARLRGK